ncbi:acyl-CoA thioesterase II [Maricurvus nonylphenolicus]|uniref:acyl-CoA thioesterase n=1 Tax=Maricurvus nonylphenolicus TaxID=1008307 RepID=UPI0036F4056F
MSFDLNQLLDYLHTERIQGNQFEGKILPGERPAVFGGQVFAQSLDAAIQTVDADRRAHSIHGHFLRAGDISQPIVFDVVELRTGRSFATRQVIATQDGKTIFQATVSFQTPEQGLSHQQAAPTSVDRDTMVSEEAYWQEIRQHRANMHQLRPTDFSALEILGNFRRDFTEPQTGEPKQQLWLKANGTLTADSNDHRLVLAFMSDMHLLTTALQAHPYTFACGKIQQASLDHTVWFYEDIDVCNWLYYDMHSPVSAGARGLNHGYFYTETGKLVAAASQEGLIRVRD